jgi:diguanylate cyclase (GGDEF)-like protein
VGQAYLYASLLVVSAIVASVIAIVAWERRNAPGAVPLMILALAMVFWAGTYALHWLSPNQPQPFFWLDATYLGVVIAPTALFVLTLQITNRGNWLKRWLIVALLIEPLLTLILLWTDSWHGWFFGGQRLPGSTTIYRGGFWFYINIFYSYGLILISMVFLVIQYLQSTILARSQTSVILLGAFLPAGINLISLLGFQPLPELDLTPIVFVISSSIFAYGLFHHQLLLIVPVARAVLIESMRDGVLVLDQQNRVIDYNPAACALLNINRRISYGAPIWELLPQWADIDAKESNKLLIPAANGAQRSVNCHITALLDNKKRQIGRLIVLRDLTELEQAYIALQELNERLQIQLEENKTLQEQLREQALRDPLTDLHNRRFLEEALPRELARAVRYAYPIAFIMLDIDHFKYFNDTYGHEAGDRLLQAIAEMLRANIRAGDIACRLGGEEFLVVLPDITEENATQRAEQLRREFEQISLTYHALRLEAKVSLGVSLFPQHGVTPEELMRAADYALYNAKLRGGNCVMVYGDKKAAGAE